MDGYALAPEVSSVSAAEPQRISVIVPAYNAARTLANCLAALQAQSDEHYEVIVVDDCSTDSSLTIARDSGFRTMHLPVNKGQAVARNAGAAEATGSVFAFVDSDVIVPPDWVATYRRLLSDFPNAAMICGGYSAHAGDSPAGCFGFYELAYRRRDMPAIIDSASGANCVVRRADFEAVGGFPEYYLSARKPIETQRAASIAEDSELAYLLTQRGATIRWTRENDAAHHFRPSWRAYFRQQSSYARAIVRSCFRFPGKLRQKGVYRGEPVLPQLALVSLTILAPVLAVLGLLNGTGAVALSLLALIGFVGFHRGFLQFLHRKRPALNWIQGIAVLYLCRVCWVWGVLTGLWDGASMRLSQAIWGRREH